MGRIGRLILVVVAVGGIAVFAALSRSGTPECVAPATTATPEWFPTDIPLPDGAETIQILDATEGLRRIALALPLSLDDTVTFIVKEWPRAGWTLGVGEREAWEAENTFVKSRKRYGQFRALLTCDPARTDLVLTMTDLPA